VDFKGRYHSEVERSSKYAARESEAKALLIRNLGKLGVQVLEGDSNYVGVQGKVQGHPSLRFDFSLWYPVPGYRSILLGYIEVTGDSVEDDYIYILSEKVEKARRVDVPVWFLYYKERMRKRVVIRAQTVVRFGTLVNWIQGEKPYYRVPLSKATSFRHWVLWFGDLIHVVNEGRWYEVKAQLTRWS